MTFVTSNANKVREAAGILGFELVPATFDLPEIQALGIAEVAAEKARAAYRLLGGPSGIVLVEDSGLVIEAWNGLPGAFTKWFVDSVGSEGILRMLSAEHNRSARAVCAVAVCGPEDHSPRVFVGEEAGIVSRVPRGEDGFGWDPIFVPDRPDNMAGLTYAQLGNKKSKDSHRARAFHTVKDWFEQQKFGL